MKTLSPYRKTLALRRQIDAANKQIQKLNNDTQVDRIVRGLKACGRTKVTFDYSHVNDGCVSGRLIGPIGGYAVSKLFGFENEHDFIQCVIRGYNTSIDTNDGSVRMHVSFDKHAQGNEELAAKLKVVHTLLKTHGIKMTAKEVTRKRDNLVKDLAEMNALIFAVEG